jgi:hypothetical protein
MDKKPFGPKEHVQSKSFLQYTCAYGDEARWLPIQSMVLHAADDMGGEEETH